MEMLDDVSSNPNTLPSEGFSVMLQTSPLVVRTGHSQSIIQTQL